MKPIAAKEQISGSESFTRWLVARQGRDNLRSPPP